MNQIANILEIFSAVKSYRIKETGNSFQHFSNSFTLKDEYCHCLTSSDTTIVVSYKFPVIGKQVAISYFTEQVTITTIWPADNTLSFRNLKFSKI